MRSASVEGEGPGGIFVLDPETFDIRGRWEADRGPQQLAYDFWWHLGHDTMITSEWGTPNMVESGVNPELLLGGKYGHALHVWDLRKRTHQQTLDLGAEQQMVLELRPAHNPTETYGFAGVVTSLKDLSASVWMWHREGNNGSSQWKIRKVIEIPAQPAARRSAATAAQGIQGGAAARDRHQSVARRSLPLCLLLGHRRIPSIRRLRSVQSRAHRQRVHWRHRRSIGASEAAGKPLNGGPQMVEVSRDGRRVYLTNSLYRSWDEQFYPDGIRGWMAKFDTKPNGGMTLDANFLLETDGLRPHQVRLEGGDASSDSYCFA